MDFIGLQNLGHDISTYQKATSDVDASKWKQAMKSEMDSMYSNGVWTLVNPPKNIKPISCNWIYKSKRDAEGNINTFKARIVARGYT